NSSRDAVMIHWVQESMCRINRTEAISGRRQAGGSEKSRNATSFLPFLRIFGVALMAWGLCFAELGLASEEKALSATHSIRGRVFLNSSSPNVPISVSLSRTSGNLPAEESSTLGYDGAFSFEGVKAGNYLLTIKSQDLPTTARAVEI